MDTIKKIEAQKEALEILKYCLQKYNLNSIDLKVKDTRRGWAYYDTRFISIPLWSYAKGLNYFYAYVLHEVSHFINNDKNNARGHGIQFKTIEKNLLLDFGMKPIYNRAYIKALTSEAGQIIFKKEV